MSNIFIVLRNGVGRLNRAGPNNDYMSSAIVSMINEITKTDAPGIGGKPVDNSPMLGGNRKLFDEPFTREIHGLVAQFDAPNGCLLERVRIHYLSQNSRLFTLPYEDDLIMPEPETYVFEIGDAYARSDIWIGDHVVWLEEYPLLPSTPGIGINTNPDRIYIEKADDQHTSPGGFITCHPELSTRDGIIRE